MQVHLFSKLELRDNTAVLRQDEMRSDRLARLLAFLIANHARSCSLAEIAETIWDEEEDVNYSGAIKTLAWRLRGLLREKWPDREFLITTRGFYQWNPDIPLEIDSEILEKKLKDARSASDDGAKEEDLREAAALYTGRYLSDYAQHYAVMTKAVFYEDLYVEIVTRLADILEQTGRYAEMERTALEAIDQVPMSEQLWCVLLKALAGEGKFDEAKRTYKRVSDMMYRKLGVGPSPGLREAYEESLKQINQDSKSLDDIMRDLQEHEPDHRAYYCEYGVFRRIYDLEERRMLRKGSKIRIVLVTLLPDRVSKSAGKRRKKPNLDQAMEDLIQSTVHAIRSGDVVTRYSRSQLLIMFPDCGEEQVQGIMERISGVYRTDTPRTGFRIHYAQRELQPADRAE